MSPIRPLTRKKTPESINYLDLTPLHAIGFQIAPTGLVELLVPRFSSKLWSRFFLTQTSKKCIRLKLDELGSSTWLLIDGKRTVNEICSGLSEQHQNKVPSPVERVTKFLSQLYVNKYLVFKELQ